MCLKYSNPQEPCMHRWSVSTSGVIPNNKRHRKKQRQHKVNKYCRKRGKYHHLSTANTCKAETLWLLEHIPISGKYSELKKKGLFIYITQGCSAIPLTTRLQFLFFISLYLPEIGMFLVTMGCCYYLQYIKFLPYMY